MEQYLMTVDVVKWWNEKKMPDRDALLLLCKVIYQPREAKKIIESKKHLRERILGEMLLT